MLSNSRKFALKKLNDSIIGLVNNSALIEHIYICIVVNNQNELVNNLYFTDVFVVILINLILLNQHLFEYLKFYIQIIYFN